MSLSWSTTSTTMLSAMTTLPPSSRFTLKSDVISVATPDTSSQTAPPGFAPCPGISKDWELSLYPLSSTPAPIYPSCLMPPCAAVDIPTPDVFPPFPLMFMYDVLVHASLAQSLLVLDCTPYRDYPLYCFISDMLYIAKDALHHLIISLHSCILHVCPMSSIFLTCFTFHIPHTIQPPWLMPFIAFRPLFDPETGVMLCLYFTFVLYVNLF